MSKLLWKESPFTNIVVRGLDNSLDYLEEAVRLIYSMSIPSSFSESAGLKNCVDEIKNIRTNVSDLKKWGENSTKKFNSALQDMNSVATLLPKSQVQIRKEVVR